MTVTGCIILYITKEAVVPEWCIKKWREREKQWSSRERLNGSRWCERPKDDHMKHAPMRTVERIRRTGAQTKKRKRKGRTTKQWQWRTSRLAFERSSKLFIANSANTLTRILSCEATTVERTDTSAKLRKGIASDWCDWSIRHVYLSNSPMLLGPLPEFRWKLKFL